MSETPNADSHSNETQTPFQTEAVRCDQAPPRESIQVQQVSMSGLWAFILSLLGFFTCCCCPCAVPIGLVAIILACVSLLKCAGNNALRGKGLAIAAIILAILGMVISVVIWFGYMRHKSAESMPAESFSLPHLKL
jgi:uncharacterized membrane protein